uniref:ATP-binding cassette domain-containing protein n=1 Tax=Phaeobacter inhibens TaxID=221822 RepID=UPI0035CCE2AA
MPRTPATGWNCRSHRAAVGGKMPPWCCRGGRIRCCWMSPCRCNRAMPLGLIGPSGAGKTTLARALVGLQPLCGACAHR